MFLFTVRTLETYFRHRFLSLLPFVFLVAVGVVVAFSGRNTYVSRSALLVQKESVLVSLTSQQLGAVSWLTPAKTTTDEFKELFNTDAFIWAIIQQTDLATIATTVDESRDLIDEVHDAIWATPWEQQLVVVGAAYRDPVIAQQLAKATVDTFINWKANREQEDAQTALDFFDQQLALYQAEMDTTQIAIKEFQEEYPAPIRGDRPPAEQAELRRLDDSLATASELYKAARDKLESARLSLSLSINKAQRTYPMIDPPKLPTRPSKTKRDMAMQLAIFGVAGMLLSVGGVVGLSLIDRTFRFESDVRNSADLPVLIVLPDETLLGRAARKAREQQARTAKAREGGSRARRAVHQEDLSP